MKKLLRVLGFLSALLAFGGFSSICIYIFKLPGMQSMARLGIGFLSACGVIISLVGMGYFMRGDLQMKEDIDDSTKDLRREEEYRKWQELLAEAEANANSDNGS